MAARANVNYFTIDPRGLVGMTSEFMEMAGGGVARAGRRSSQSAARHRRRNHGRHRRDRSVHRSERIDVRAAAVAGQPARACRRDRRHRLSEHELADRHVRAHRARRTAAITCSAITRPITRATGDSTRSKCASNARACASKRAAGMHRRADGPPRSENATKRHGASVKPGARTPTRHPTELRSVLSSPLQKSGLNFTVHAAPFRNTQKEASVALAIEIDGDRLQYRPTKTARSRTGSSSRSSASAIRGRQSAERGRVLDLTLRPETRERVRPTRRSRQPARQPRTGPLSAAHRRTRRGGGSDRVGVLRPRGPRFPKRETDDGRVAARRRPHLSRRRAFSPTGGGQAAARRGDEPPCSSREGHARAVHRDLRQHSSRRPGGSISPCG